MKKLITISICLFIFLVGNTSNAQESKVQYSAVVKVNIKKVAETVSVFPNPVIGNTINLKINAEKGNYFITITNQAGQVISTKTINHNGGTAIQPINVQNNFASGIYLMHINGNGISETINVFKQ